MAKLRAVNTDNQAHISVETRKFKNETFADEASTLRVYGHLFTDKKNESVRKQRAEALVL